MKCGRRLGGHKAKPSPIPDGKGWLEKPYENHLAFVFDGWQQVGPFPGAGANGGPGWADIVTRTRIIEVKSFGNNDGAIDQVLRYHAHVPSLRATVAYPCKPQRYCIHAWVKTLRMYHEHDVDLMIYENETSEWRLINEVPLPDVARDCVPERCWYTEAGQAFREAEMEASHAAWEAGASARAEAVVRHAAYLAKTEADAARREALRERMTAWWAEHPDHPFHLDRYGEREPFFTTVAESYAFRDWEIQA